MLIVYIAQRCYDYDTSLIIGIYQTREEAQAACDKDYNWGDSHNIEEFELGKYYGDD